MADNRKRPIFPSPRGRSAARIPRTYRPADRVGPSHPPMPSFNLSQPVVITGKSLADLMFQFGREMVRSFSKTFRLSPDQVQDYLYTFLYNERSVNRLKLRQPYLRKWSDLVRSSRPSSSKDNYPTGQEESRDQGAAAGVPGLASVKSGVRSSPFRRVEAGIMTVTPNQETVGTSAGFAIDHKSITVPCTLEAGTMTDLPFMKSVETMMPGVMMENKGNNFTVMQIMKSVATLTSLGAPKQSSATSTVDLHLSTNAETMTCTNPTCNTSPTTGPTMMTAGTITSSLKQDKDISAMSLIRPIKRVGTLKRRASSRNTQALPCFVNSFDVGTMVAQTDMSDVETMTCSVVTSDIGIMTDGTGCLELN